MKQFNFNHQHSSSRNTLSVFAWYKNTVRLLAVICVLIVFIHLGFFFYVTHIKKTYVLYKQKELEQNEITAQIKNFKSLIHTLQNTELNTPNAQADLKAHKQFFSLLDATSKLLPKTAHFDVITYKPHQEYSISGTACMSESVHKFFEALVQEKIFPQTKLNKLGQHTQQDTNQNTNQNNSQDYVFTITGLLHVNAESSKT